MFRFHDVVLLIGSSENDFDLRFFSLFQVSTLREKVIKVLNTPLPTRTKMVTGCLLEMFHGSKFFLHFFSFFSQLSTIYIYIYVYSYIYILVAVCSCRLAKG